MSAASGFSACQEHPARQKGVAGGRRGASLPCRFFRDRSPALLTPDGFSRQSCCQQGPYRALGLSDSDTTQPPQHTYREPHQVERSHLGGGKLRHSAGTTKEDAHCAGLGTASLSPLPQLVLMAGTVGTETPCPTMSWPPSPKPCHSTWVKSCSRVTPASRSPATCPLDVPIPFAAHDTGLALGTAAQLGGEWAVHPCQQQECYRQ